MTPIIGIAYQATAAQPHTTYRGVTVLLPPPGVADRYHTGDVCRDWAECLAALRAAGTQPTIAVSCDTFVADCRGIYTWTPAALLVVDAVRVAAA